MRKYAPLHDYLRKKPGPHLQLTFADIERVIGELLPKSASRAQWWANEASPESRHVQCNDWLNAGYEAFLLPNDRVEFRRRLR